MNSTCSSSLSAPLQWCHNERHGVLNHQHFACLLNRFFRRISNKTSKPRITGLLVGNPPVTRGFPSQRASDAENISIWWRHHGEWRPGARPTNDISIEFEIRPNFAVLWFKMFSTDHNEISHTSRQCNCRDVCKISLWSSMYILN